MQVTIIQKRKGELSERETLLLVDNETLISVTGLGIEGYEFTVENVGEDNLSYNPSEIIYLLAQPKGKSKGLVIFKDFFGVGGIWFNPLTFAHAVMDVINNQ